MKIIPAIDVMSGKCVRLTQGDFNSQKVYSDDPVVVAQQFEQQGIKYLHVVDLDGARSGKTMNLHVLKEIVLN
ncbi:MAG: HisA/HisF-related TIM barrel protein, partial [Saprospiraceae bacterium]